MTARFRLGMKLTTAGIEAIRELREDGHTDRKQLTASVASEIFFIGVRFCRAAGMNRATLDVILRKTADQVYAEPGPDETIVMALN